jgi:hypothetical protein
MRSVAPWQWLFPVFENAGMNWESSPLTKEGAALIRQDPAASARVVRSYRLMLRFYGLQLKDARTGEIERYPGIYEERLDNLNWSSHNWLRISRILTSLGELGFRRYKAPLLKHLRVRAPPRTQRMAGFDDAPRRPDSPGLPVARAF